MPPAVDLFLWNLTKVIRSHKPLFAIVKFAKSHFVTYFILYLEVDFLETCSFSNSLSTGLLWPIL